MTVTADLDSLLEQLETLHDDDIWLLGEVWRSGDEGARRRAWDHAKKQIPAAGRERDLDRARLEVSRWMRTNPTDFSGIEGLLGQSGGAVQGRQAAAPAIIDAAAAVLAGDALAAEDQDVLLAPWRALEAADRAGADELDVGDEGDG